MSSIISSMLQQIFPKSESRALFIGLDASGKTSILYKMKLGEVITTIPTIGFNVETISLPKISITIWDVGGCDKIRPLWRHYYQNTQAIIYVVDSNDNERFDESIKLFQDTVTSEELLEAVILVFFNKSDLVPIASVDLLKKKFLQINESILGVKSGYTRRLFYMQSCCAISGDGLTEGFNWLEDAVLKSPVERVEIASVAAREIQEKDRLESQLEEWLSREDEEDDLFIERLKECTLENWDHRTHLRIAFILLQKHGRRDGMQLIFSYIKHFIENSPRTKRGANSRGTTFHETMTYFWVHMVHYAMEYSRLSGNRQHMTSKDVSNTTLELNNKLENAAITVNAVTASAVTTTIGSDANAISSSTDDKQDQQAKTTAMSAFKLFLLMNPQLSNGGLFLHYYSKHRMLNDPDARVMVLLPDKIPLPSLLVDVDAMRRNNNITATGQSAATGGFSGNSNNSMLPPREPLTDAHFLHLLASQRLPGWGHEVKLRIIYLLLCYWGRNSRSVDAILDVLKSIEKETGYHMTINYFWITMISYHIAVEIKNNGSNKAAAVFAAFNDSNYRIPTSFTLQDFVINSDTNNNTISTTTASSLLLPIPPDNATTTTSSVSLQTLAIDDKSNKVSSNSSSSSMAFITFILSPHCQSLRNSLLYEKYYSRNIIDGTTSAVELCLPDLKTFPSIIH